MEDHKLTLKSILFICNINSIRSPMAEAILKLWFNKKIFIDSCGIRKGKIDHMAVEVMKEKGFDLVSNSTNFPEIELSGGIRFDNLKSLNKFKGARVSIGALTTQANNADLSMDLTLAL